jgi:hypothetical protein
MKWRLALLTSVLTRNLCVAAVERRVLPPSVPIRSLTLRGGMEPSASAAPVVDVEEQEVLALPAASGDPTKVTVNGGSVSLEDEMGPLVVGNDGSLSRIANWSEMTAVERERTVKILGKRNKLRLDTLRAQQGDQGTEAVTPNEK